MNATDELEQLRTGSALVERTGRGVVVVDGPDAVSFLQVLVSADLDAVPDGAGTPCLLLSPQGKLDVRFRLLRVGDALWLDCDPGLGAQLAASLTRYRIRVDADVSDCTERWRVVSLIGPGVATRWTGPVPAVPLHAHVSCDGARVVRTEWGLDLVGPADAVTRAGAELGLDRWPRVGDAAYDAWRIERGIAVQPADLDATTIPQEAFLELDAVSFTKGCFLGQELVCRIDSRGHVNRFLRRIERLMGDPAVPGAEIVADGKVVGTITSVASPELAGVALGFVRREVEPPAAVELRWPGGAARGTVVALDHAP